MNEESFTGFSHLIAKNHLAVVEGLEAFHWGNSVNFSDRITAESQTVLGVIVGFDSGFQLRSITAV